MTCAAPLALIDVVVNCACPLLNVTGLPEFTLSTWNCTVPVGVLDDGAFADTVAVKVTGSPNTVGLFEVTMPVVVEPWFTVRGNADEVLPAKFVSPP